MGNQLQTLDRATGEVTTTPTFDMGAYLDDVTSARAFKTQQALAAAYDHAVAALIGPNDVQEEKGRTFKKKSAWRKLARHFQISTSVVAVERGWEEAAGEPDYVAVVTVRATAPWGQSAEAVGACATSEAVGRRVITVADALATAETRATNRAVSNLIAMGEVSAEEMSKEAKAPSGSRSAPRSDGVPRLPGAAEKWGGNGGKPLAEVPLDVLGKFAAWVGKQEEPSESLVRIAAAANEEIERRAQAAADPEPVGLLDGDPDVGRDLPF